MKHSTWGGPSGIVHGWIPYRGNESLGWVPVCYPNGAHPGWACHPESGAIPHGHGSAVMKWTKDPIDCKRCLKRLRRPIAQVKATDYEEHDRAVAAEVAVILLSIRDILLEKQKESPPLTSDDVIDVVNEVFLPHCKSMMVER